MSDSSTQLGEGGMATIWKIEDSRLLRSVALEQLRQDKTASHHEHENYIVRLKLPHNFNIQALFLYTTFKSMITVGSISPCEIRGQTLEVIIQSVHKVSNAGKTQPMDGTSVASLKYW